MDPADMVEGLMLSITSVVLVETGLALGELVAIGIGAAPPDSCVDVVGSVDVPDCV